MSDLEYRGMMWLYWLAKAKVVCFERTPRPSAGQPDVLGVTAAGFLIEIECKRSVADFRANNSKRHIKLRNELEGLGGDVGPHNRYLLESTDKTKLLARFPKQFYFLVPETIANKINVPPWAGLLIDSGDYYPTAAKTAPTNKHATKLKPLEWLKLMRCMTNQIYSFAQLVHTHNANKDNPEYVPPGCEAMLI